MSARALPHAHTDLISIYLTNFGAYNEVYGSIGAVIAMLMWLFISVWLVLLGGR